MIFSVVSAARAAPIVVTVNLIHFEFGGAAGGDDDDGGKINGIGPLLV